MKLILVALAVAGLSGACAPMQDIDRVPEVNPTMAETFAQTKSFVYERSIVRGERGEPTVTVEAGLACVPHAQGFAKSGQYAATNQEYENAFQEELARVGYRVAQTVGGGDLFTDKKDIAADYRVAGVVSRPRMNVCFPLAGFGNFTSGKGEASLTVEWQLYSNAQKSVVYSTTQKGYAKLDSSVAGPVSELWREAFARAVRGLLADQGFVSMANGVTAPPTATRISSSR
jgi:serine protease Do